jgi:glycosyltransferase involved in cell wall biosynthesis
VLDETRKVVVVLNGVDAGAFAPTPDTGRLRQELGLAPSVPIVGSVGRLETIKGYEVLIKAFALVQQQWLGEAAPVLILAGDGSERPRLETLATQLLIRPRVHFLGWRDDLRDLLSCFDIFALASHSEGTSISLLEAMSAGVCPVVTDVGGNAAVLGPTLQHRLVRPNDAAALAHALIDGLCRSAARQSDARDARRRVLSAFTVDRVARDYESLYRGDITDRNLPVVEPIHLPGRHLAGRRVDRREETMRQGIERRQRRIGVQVDRRAGVDRRRLERRRTA